MKDKVYHLLNDKLFDIAILYKMRDLEQYPPADSMPVLMSEIFDRAIWRTYLDEMGFFKLVLSGWFKNEDLDGDSLEDFSFTDPQGQKVNPKWIEENLIIVVDPLNNYQKVGIPKEIALKAIVLGHFPDSPSIRKMRECNE